MHNKYSIWPAVPPTCRLWAAAGLQLWKPLERTMPLLLPQVNIFGLFHWPHVGLTMSFSDPLWLLLSRVGKIRTDGHWAYWECFIVLCKYRLKNTWIHWEKKASGKGKNLGLKFAGPHGSSLLEIGAWLWGQAFGDISGCLTPRVQVECVAQLVMGNFLDGFIIQSIWCFGSSHRRQSVILQSWEWGS